ncbi:MAG: putative porin [Prevotella sp.]|nr:putative porin [Candidatus Prevotella equi]
MQVWTIDKFGDITKQVPDTAVHLFMNSVFNTGTYGEYTTTGNQGSPRISRIATDRRYTTRFAFVEPYSYFVTDPTDLRFTNTLSPMTHLYYNSAGNRDNGEDHIKALFATNVNKQIGLGFKFNYLYARGYYNSQSVSLFDYTLWASYLGPRYQAHFIMTFNHLKEALNGGITNDEYVTHPEASSVSFDSDEIPTVLNNNWQRNDVFNLTLSHRYNLGFYRKVRMTDDEIEARKFAIEAKKEREASGVDDKGKEKKRKTEARPDNAKVQQEFQGRPSDAKIVGDLKTDSLKSIILAKDSLASMADSLLAKNDTLTEDTTWLKDEYVPVTSFIHNLNIDNYQRTYIAHTSPSNYYNNVYDVPEFNAIGSKIYDETKLFSVRNNFAIGLLEGFNKYIPMGGKVYIANDIRNYKLPDINNTYSSITETDVNVGAQIEKTTGRIIHYKATAEFGIAGKSAGDVNIDATGDVNVRMFKDTLTLKLKGFYHLNTPSFYQRRFQSKHFWWNHNDDFSKQMHTHLEGMITYPKSKTTVRVAYDNLQNYVYLAESYNRSSSGNITNFTADYRQTSKNISLITIALEQNARLGILNWENRLTFQKSSDDKILAVPLLNFWTNLYLDFRIAKVLKVNFGAEMFWFSKYYAQEFCSQLGQYAVQENDQVKTKVGGYPYVNVYCNFKLKQCRFYVMMSHVNSGMGEKNYFLTPHHPMNERLLRLGLAWIFHN